MHTVNADTLGSEGVWFDPVWRVRVHLTSLERELRGTWWVRRLACVSHAGAASITTTQSYTRLEHSLGTLALVAHFAPDDHAARATALLHDIGHLPFSHTLEGIAGLDHHTISHARIDELGPVLERHGTTAKQVIAIDSGEVPSPLRSAPGRMKLDHLDSFVRSAQAHGRTVIPPPEILARSRLVGGTVDTDAETAAELTRLVIAEARAQRAAPNVVPVAVLRSLVLDALSDPAAAMNLSALETMTDDELWSALLCSESTRERARAFRRNPGAWQLLKHDDEVADNETEPLEHLIERGYLSLPTISGATTIDSDVQALERDLPARYRIVRAAA